MREGGERERGRKERKDGGREEKDLGNRNLPQVSDFPFVHTKMRRFAPVRTL
jgi:hypothetical protein